MHLDTLSHNSSLLDWSITQQGIFDSLRIGNMSFKGNHILPYFVVHIECSKKYPEGTPFDNSSEIQDIKTSKNMVTYTKLYKCPLLQEDKANVVIKHTIKTFNDGTHISMKIDETL